MQWLRWFRWFVLFLLGGLVLVGGLFVWNTAGSGWEKPGSEVLPFPTKKGRPTTLKVMAFNIAHGFSRHGYRFKKSKVLKAHLRKIASLIRKIDPDVVFLSEVDLECTPCGVKPLRFLAEQSKYPYVVSGENYNFGLPFYRIRAGLGILSKYRLEGEKVVQLPGARPFYQPAGNRRILWARLTLGKQNVRIASIHNESFSSAINVKQARSILKELGSEPALLAGDFNDVPSGPSIGMLRRSKRFTAAWNGKPTFPAKGITIDFVLAPQKWKLLSHQAIPTSLSDHYPVVSVFLLPTVSSESSTR